MQSPDDLLWQLAVPSRLGEKPTLERMRRLLSELGEPQRGLPVLHIGGTSGKGSTATIAERILREAGYRVGLHVKPHLERVEERFLVDGRQISSARLLELLEAAAPAARTVGPTWYELTVAVALQYFRAERVDLAVVEVGLGGRFDGTNVVEPRAVVLTNVGLDHTEILGDTVEKIAADKVGIFKAGAPVISGVAQPTVREIVAARAREVNAPLWQLGREITFTPSAVDAEGSSFDLALPTRRFADLRLKPRGVHQIANAALAVAGIEALAPSGVSIPEEALRRALASVEVAGRLEVVGERPLIVLDGAHNPAKMAALVEALRQLYPDRRVTGVVACKRGHDLSATLGTLLPCLRRIVLTRFDADTDFGRGQSVEPAAMERVCVEQGATRERVIEPDPIRALEYALRSTGPEDLICVTGSLYLVGAVRSWLRNRG